MDFPSILILLAVLLPAAILVGRWIWRKAHHQGPGRGGCGGGCGACPHQGFCHPDG